MMNTTRTLIATATLMALAACQTTPGPNPDLASARASLDQARSNAYVGRSGAVELQSAQQAMTRAENAWAADRDVDQTRHLAYLARQRAEIATAVGLQAQYDERVQQFTAEREKVRLQARTYEADVATADARAAQADARNAQADARNAQTDAQVSKDQADAARLLALQQAGRAEGLERDLAELKASKTDRGMVVTLGDVLFDTGKSTLQPGAQHSVAQLVQVLVRHPERRVLIEGYTDSVGSESMNMQLSQRRAETFQRELMNGGIAADRIEVRAWGEANPVADNDSAAGRQRNRRVEVLFSDAEGHLATR
ncbi:MAG: flagellar motor protein MotB [Burkholderiales bacterium PBB1]|nr:MAG: flagellar motor protein MotB [Burkholderiales bacterium PBB1]